MMPFMFPKVKHIELVFFGVKLVFFQMNQETASENDLRDIFGFYNYSSYTEIKRIIEQKIENYSDHFNQFGKIQSDHIQEVIFSLKIALKGDALSLIYDHGVLDARAMGRFDDEHAEH